MAGTDVTSGIERLQAAIALGIGLKVGELVEIQRAHVDSEVVDLLRSDIAKAASHPDLSPAIHTCLADHSSVEVLSLIHISEPRDRTRSRMPSSA